MGMGNSELSPFEYFKSVVTTLLTGEIEFLGDKWESSDFIGDALLLFRRGEALLPPRGDDVLPRDCLHDDGEEDLHISDLLSKSTLLGELGAGNALDPEFQGDLDLAGEFRDDELRYGEVEFLGDRWEMGDFIGDALLLSPRGEALLPPRGDEGL